MRNLLPLFGFLILFCAACSGGSSLYGCPAKSGHSCKSVSRVYEETGVDAATAVSPDKYREKKKRARRAEGSGKNLRKGEIFGRAKAPGNRLDKTAKDAEDRDVMPVYVPPPTIHLWIAPWQDARGVFHSEKYVYILAGRGRWTIRGKPVPLGEPEGKHPGIIPLLGTEKQP